jgi:tetratricopeptide (TPR) repeat protein
MYEQAIEFFEQASAVQPSEVKWRLMVTSCYILGDYFRALELYQQIHEEHPTNVESLQYLVIYPAVKFTLDLPSLLCVYVCVGTVIC